MSVRLSPILLGFGLALAAGCGSGDGDLDGYSPSEGDCDDTDAAVNPGAVEACDGLDNNCDGEVDEGFDGDEDGFVSCDLGTDALVSAADCDDTDAAVYPGATEVWGDGVDSDCDGIADADRYVVTGAAPEEGKPTHASIQEAIDAAADGEVIGVAAGTWRGSIDFVGKQIKVVAMSGVDLTTLVGDADASAVRFASGEPSGAWLKGFTVRAGGGDSAGVCGHAVDLSHGGAVCISSASPTLTENVFTDSSASYGGGIYILDGSPRIEANTLRNNHASWGAGIFMIDSAPQLTRDVIEDNVATLEGGGVAAESSRPRVRHCEIATNRARRGGGVYVDASTVTLVNNRIYENDASEGGGGLYLLDVDGTLSHSVIRANTAQEGAGIYLYGGAVDGHNLIIQGNVAEGDGGGIYISRDAAPALRNLTLAGNEADVGGGVWSYASSPTLYDSIFATNKATSGAYSLAISAGFPEIGYNLYSAVGSTNPYESVDPTQVDAAGAGVVGLELDTGDLTGDPGFWDGPTDNDLDDDDYHLRTTSVAIDAGQPTGKGGELDPDGSDSDLGAFGGEGAAGWDLDGDGAYQWWSPDTNSVLGSYDCDDEDPDEYPGHGC